MDTTNQIQQILSKAGNYVHGRDSEDDVGMTYTSILQWKQESGLSSASASTSSASPDDANQQQEQNEENRQQWYETGLNYYEDENKCPATIDGVLGGFGKLSTKDLKGSADFLEYLCTNIRPTLKLTKETNDGGVPTRACECGAGIGRVSKGLLLPLGITQCDLVEPSPRLIASAPEYLGDAYSNKCRYFCKGLQDFEPAANYYDIIWIQWVIIYLTDEDLVAFLKRCAAALTNSGGVIVIKDNVCDQEAFIVDRDDASVTRSLEYVLAIAELAGLRVVYKRFQEDFPTNIFPVPIIAFEPKIKS